MDVNLLHTRQNVACALVIIIWQSGTQFTGQSIKLFVKMRVLQPENDNNRNQFTSRKSSIRPCYLKVRKFRSALTQTIDDSSQLLAGCQPWFLSGNSFYLRIQYDDVMCTIKNKHCNLYLHNYFFKRIKILICLNNLNIFIFMSRCLLRYDPTLGVLSLRSF